MEKMPKEIPCPDCDNLISNEVRFCMHCGAEQPVRQSEELPFHANRTEFANPLFCGSLCATDDDMDISAQEKEYWEGKSGADTMRAIGWLLKAIKERMPAGLACSAGKAYISIVPIGQTRRTDYVIYPQKKSIVFSVRLPESDQLQQALKSSGATLMGFDGKSGRSRFSITPDLVETAEGLLLELLAEALREQKSSPDASVAHSVAPEEQNFDTNNEGDGAMRLTNVLKQWAKDQEWEEVPEIDEENRTSSIAFGYGVGDFSLKGFFEVDERIAVFKLYLYFLDTKIPEKRLDEIQKLVNLANSRMMIGMLQLISEDRIIRYYGAIDVENAAFEPAHITNLIGSGGGAMTSWLPRYMAVCFGGKTAEESLEDTEE